MNNEAKNLFWTLISIIKKSTILFYYQLIYLFFEKLTKEKLINIIKLIYFINFKLSLS